MYYFTRRNGWKWCCVDATAEPRKGCLQKHGRLINHSIKNANCKMVVEEYNHTPHLILVAKEDIKAGTELLYDYGERNKEVIKNFPWLME
jgi:histone-lysine N-methyltransferase SETD8